MGGGELSILNFYSHLKEMKIVIEQMEKYYLESVDAHS